MLTCCPACRTCFRITEPQLAVAQGKVRCGKCKTVFNARQHLQSPAEPAPVTSATATPPAPDTATEQQTDHIDLFRAPASDETPSPSPTDDIEPPSSEPPAPEPPPESDSTERVVPDMATDTQSETEIDTPFEPATEENTTSLETDPGEAVSEPLSQTETSPEADSPGEATPGDTDFEPETVEIPMPEMDAPDEPQNSTGDELPVNDDEPQAAPAEPDAPTTTADGHSRYQFNSFDDEGDSFFDKELDDILAEMNQQLSLAIETPETTADTPKSNPEDYQPATASFGESSGDELGEAIDSLFDDVERETTVEQNEEQAPVAVDLDSVDDAPADTSETRAEESEALTSDPSPDEPLPEDEPHTPSATDQETDANIPFHLRDSLAVKPPEPRSRVALLGGGVLILLLLGALALQLALFRPLDVIRLVPQSQPYLEQLCQQLPCHFQSHRAPEQIRLLNRDVRAHPEQDGVLLITATLVNQAEFAQPYPDMRVTLFDLSGNPVAQRRFTPDDYLGQLNSPFMQMQPQTPLQINLDVVDPGANAVNFEFDFL